MEASITHNGGPVALLLIKETMQGESHGEQGKGSLKKGGWRAGPGLF